MRAKMSFLIGAILATSLFAACAVSGSPTPPPSTAISVVDDAGRTVELPRAAHRIVSLSPSNTELVFAAGAGNLVVGVDDYSDFPTEAKSIEKVGGFAKTNIEKVVSLAPDLVLATNIHEKAVMPELEARGLKVVLVQPKNVAAVLDSIKLVGKLTGHDRVAGDLASTLQTRLDAITSKLKSAKSTPRVYFELDVKMFTGGPGSFVDDMIARAGGQNIAGDAKTQWPQLSPETIVLKDPEVIIVVDMGNINPVENVKARPGWQVISALKSGRVVKMNGDLTNRPGPRVVDGLEEMARLLQPELFR